MKDLVEKISKIFNEEDVRFIVIGALARDIFFESKGINLDIGTKDIDFAIFVENWDFFNKVKAILKDKMGMVEDTPLLSLRSYLGAMSLMRLKLFLISNFILFSRLHL